ncbi:hypothetical protein V7S43_000696 [Phytophthora oleae]|uniref:EF-hand domain-containing protein n=1 Tax=Phytophthora oleae TaxID=2107226 RepID=A0ABD3G7V7_9STRA
MFYKCTFHEASVSTIVADDNTANTHSTRLRLPIDTRRATTAELPEIAIQMMGVTKTLGEICLGESSIDLLEISDLCYLVPSSRESLQVERFIWREFTDKSDRMKTTGIVKLHVGFEEIIAQRQIAGDGKTREKRGVASAELFTIWKKLFYLLDQNNNGYIDRNEFTDVFVNHLEDMTGTSDGRKLLQLLFGDEDNQDNDIAPTAQQITTLFSVMDTNRDNEIEWSEYLRFLQQRQQQIFTEDEGNPATDILEVTSEQKRELKRKNREDRCKLPSTESNQDDLPPEKTREALMQEPAPPKRPGKVSSSEEKRLKLHYSNQEQSRLQQQITTLESILAIERRRYAELAADRQALMRSYQQLHLKHQNELLQEQTKAKWMKQTIERQQQQLEEREKLRRNRNEASIVLQSTVRSRLEQKRYQGLKLQRVNAALTIQCMIRQVAAKHHFQALQEMDRVVKLRTSSASKMQRFTRFHLHRKERALLVEARVLSATILQKNTRRMLAGKAWRTQKMMVLKLQCWVRQRRAVRNFTQRRVAVSTVIGAVLRWFTRWKYVKKVRSSRKIQRWWRRASRERSVYLTRVEASLCIQSAWKRRTTRKWFEREWQRQEKYIADLDATICIQAAWRGRRQRSKSVRSSENTLRFNDDSAIEALVYDLVAMIEADVVILSSLTTTRSVLNESTSKKTVVGEEAPPEDSIVSTMQDVPVSSEEKEADMEVLGVLNDIVEAVISADTDGIAERKGDFEILGDEGSGDHRIREEPVISAEGEANNSSEEVPENADANQSNITNSAAKSDSQHESDDEPPSVFDTDVAEGDLMIPNANGSNEANRDSEDAGGSSIDSTDLMMEADAMTILQDAPESENLSVVASVPRHRKTTRVDSLVLLADVDKLNAQSNPDT